MSNHDHNDVDASTIGSKPVERREAYYRGHVQGVGFRYSVRHLAGGYRVAGFVRNLPDGRVHLIAEGQREELQRFLDAVAAHLANHIRDTTLDVRPATGEFVGFEIRH
jgi:acylphosphatase